MSRAPLQRPTTYDIDQERVRHDDAVHWFGEMTCFLSWWRPADREAGLVGPCTTCNTKMTDSRIVEAYGQAAQHLCPNCYGTTFEGGLRSIFYRPAIWNLTPVEHDVKRRGEVEIIRGTLQVISNLDLHDGDHAVRADGTCWKMDQASWQEITTGFGSQRGVTSRRLQSAVQIALEDDKSTAPYLVDVNFDALNLIGWEPYVPHSPHPLDVDNVTGGMP